jgi:predicted ATPase
VEASTGELEKRTLFISRAGADADIAAEIAQVLESAGHGVILQQWHFANRSFVERMHDALSGATHVVALLSPQYFSSDYCQAEWMNAIADDPLNRNGRLILLRVSDCEPPGLLAGLAYWDLVPIRSDHALLAEAVCNAVSRDHCDPAAGAGPYRRAPQSPLSAGLAQSNLPQEAKSFIGREAEVAEIKALAADARLVTLVGVGGVGKTSCSLKAAAGLVGSYPDGVWFVDLAPITEPGLVAAEVAAVFGLVESAKRPIAETLMTHLREKRTLILLDNCEHLIEPCSRLAAALLRTCPAVSFLATSREALKVGGERIYHLPTLGIPEPHLQLTVDEAKSYGSIALFVDRARAAESRFELTSQNTASVAEICRRLDGIPLAIELAAARVRVLAPRQIEQKLDERFRILTGGARTALPRQQTMRALIDWSYDLLDGREQSLLSGLSIFSGSFSLESATAVCAGDELEEFDVLDGLTSLVEKSLVVAESSEDDTRYHLLESMREYGRERLDANGKRAEIARRHAVAYTELAERLEQEYGSTPYRTWVARAECEIENIRAALGWAFGPEGDVEVGLRLAAMLRRIFNTSQPAEARRWVQTALGRVSADSPPRVVAQLELARISHRGSTN